MSEDETTTEVLAEIEGQATEYTPPDGWRVVRFGEQLLPGDVWVSHDGTERRSDILHWDASAVSGGRCIRRIEPQPQPQPEPQPVQVREGRWRTRGGEIRNVTPTPEDDDRVTQYPWYDAEYDQTWASNGRCYLDEESQRDLVQYVGPIEPEPEPEKVITPDDVAGEALGGVWNQVQAERTIEDLQHRLDVVSREWALQAGTISGLQQQVENRQQEYERQKSRIEFLETLNAGNGAAIADYIAKVAKLQSLVDTARQQLEASATECGSVTTRLEAVAAERDRQADTIRRLQIELDAAQQVPQAVSDRFEEGWDAGTARAVETIAEWLEPLRKGNCTLRAAVLFHLPAIMRSLTGLTDKD